MRTYTLVLVCAVLAALVAVNTVTAEPEPWRGNELEDEFRYSDDDGALEAFNNVERRGKWECAQWGDFCKPDAKMKYVKCCKGLRCMCGHFWTKGKCECKSGGTFG